MPSAAIEELAAWLSLRLDADEAWTIAVSQMREPGTVTGEHWRWVCSRCDAVVWPDPATDELITCHICGTVEAALRSVEGYPWESKAGSGVLPSIVLDASRVPSVAGVYLLGHMPATELGDIAARREIITWVLEQQSSRSTIGDDFVFPLYALAQRYAGYPGFRDEWRMP